MAGFTGAPPIVTDGLVFAVDAANHESYPGSGTTWSDLSGNGNNAVLYNSPTFENNVISMSTNERANVTSYTDTDDVTICMFLKINTLGTRGILGRNSTSASTSGWTVWVWPNGSNLLRFFNANTSNYTPSFDLQPAMSYTIGEWFMASFTRDTTNQIIKTYKNALLDDSETISGTPKKTNDDINIGSLGSGFNFNGSFGPIMIYNRTLTSSEILQNYNALKSRFNLD